MSWGKKIILAYVAFIAIIATLVSMSLYEDVDLISPDYYEQELKYQDVINAENAAAQRPFFMEFSADGLLIRLDSVSAQLGYSGDANFLRPSDKSLDFTVPLSGSPDGLTLVPSGKFTSGRYEADITWKSDGITLTRRETVIAP